MVPLADVFNHKASVVHLGDQYAIAEFEQFSPESSSDEEAPSGITNENGVQASAVHSYSSAGPSKGYDAKHAAATLELACAKRPRVKEALALVVNPPEKGRRLLSAHVDMSVHQAPDRCDMTSLGDEAGKCNGLDCVGGCYKNCGSIGSDEGPADKSKVNEDDAGSDGSDEGPRDKSRASDDDAVKAVDVGGADAAAETAFFCTFSSCNLKLEIAICCEVQNVGDSQAEVLRILAAQDLEAHAQVHNTYGEHGNDALLYQYGFALRTNPFHSIKFSAKEIAQQMIEHLPKGEMHQYACFAGQAASSRDGTLPRHAIAGDMEKLLLQFLQTFMFTAPGSVAATKVGDDLGRAVVEICTHGASTSLDGSNACEGSPSGASVNDGSCKDDANSTSDQETNCGTDSLHELLLYGNGFTDGLFACVLLQLGLPQGEALEVTASRQAAVEWAAKQLTLPGTLEIHRALHLPLSPMQFCNVAPCVPQEQHREHVACWCMHSTDQDAQMLHAVALTVDLLLFASKLCGMQLWILLLSCHAADDIPDYVSLRQIIPRLSMPVLAMLSSLVQSRLNALKHCVKQLARAKASPAYDQAECSAVEWQQACNGIDALALSEIDILQQSLLEVDAHANKHVATFTEARSSREDTVTL
jgi:hypothetical protein